MGIRLRITVLFMLTWGIFATTPCARPSDLPSNVKDMVQQFPSLEDLESHLAAMAQDEGAPANPPAKAHADSGTTGGSYLPVSARWFTAAQTHHSFSAPAPSPNARPGEKPLAVLLADMAAVQASAAAINKQIVRQNDLAINKYLLDRVTASARTDYGTNITGLFVNGVGFGSFHQSLRQSYGINYSLPLLQRYAHSSNWTRLLSGWSVSSSVGVMPQLSDALQLQQLLNNLQLTWSVSFGYDLSGATARRIRDGQFAQEAALDTTLGRAAVMRDVLLKRMALRVDALSTTRPVRDTRLTSLRELYPQFELYQARYLQAASCDERMEDFFTLKGLALSLLTMAGYDRPDNSGRDLLQTWKHARFAGCGRI